MTPEEKEIAWKAAKALYEVSRVFMRWERLLTQRWWCEVFPYKHEEIEEFFVGLGFSDLNSIEQVATATGNLNGIEMQLLTARDCVLKLPESNEVFFAASSILSALSVFDCSVLIIDGMPVVGLLESPPDYLLEQLQLIISTLLRRCDADLARSAMILNILANSEATSEAPNWSRELTRDDLCKIASCDDHRTAFRRFESEHHPLLKKIANGRYVIDLNRVSVEQLKKYKEFLG